MPRNRMMEMEGAMNFRDLGGIKLLNNRLVCDGVLFRSDGLSRLTVNDLQLFSSLKINTVVDLRHSEEIAKAPDRLPKKIPVQSRTYGFYAEGTMELFQVVNSGQADALESKLLMQQVYAKMPIKHTKEIRQIIVHLLQHNTTPCLIHCMSGKDRTGLVIAIILKAIGAPLSAIIDDYEMSNGDYQTVDVFGPDAPAESIAMVMAADASYLQASFTAVIETYDTFDNYLANGLMLEQTDIDGLKHLLVS